MSSSKFCEKLLGRITVQSTPASRTTRSASTMDGSNESPNTSMPRPDRTTKRRQQRAELDARPMS